MPKTRSQCSSGDVPDSLSCCMKHYYEDQDETSCDSSVTLGSEDTVPQPSDDSDSDYEPSSSDSETDEEDRRPCIIIKKVNHLHVDKIRR